MSAPVAVYTLRKDSAHSAQAPVHTARSLYAGEDLAEELLRFAELPVDSHYRGLALRRLQEADRFGRVKISLQRFAVTVEPVTGAAA